MCVRECGRELCMTEECHKTNKALGDVRDCRGLPGSASMSPAAVVLCLGFGSSTVAVSAIFSLGRLRGLEAV